MAAFGWLGAGGRHGWLHICIYIAGIASHYSLASSFLWFGYLKSKFEAAFCMLTCHAGNEIFQGKDWWQSAIVPFKTCEELSNMGYSSRSSQAFIRTAASRRHWSQVAVFLEGSPKSREFIYRRIKACFKPQHSPVQALFSSFGSLCFLEPHNWRKLRYFPLRNAEGDAHYRCYLVVLLSIKHNNLPQVWVYKKVNKIDVHWLAP